MKFFFLPVLLSLMLTGVQSVSGANATTAINPDTLTQQQLQDFGEEAKIRIKAFVDFLGIIADKDRSFDERNGAIRQALLMFKKDVSVEVSNINTGTRTTLPLRQYLEKIKALKYDKVQITNFESVRLDSWKKQPDGSYQATGQYFQAFKAWRNGVPVYQDKTTKKIEADLRVREDPFYKEKNWMVLLGNITVDATVRDDN
ncbi:hypothetical protein [Larkinella sp.]|uniref:hypothetical protein n=1 Tax=Larkinella sp. TaxID=2034517 RepID=UPI003BA939E2